jgi:1-acyl-sn-glycerol-3-phosphate acyltransferase
LWNLLLSIFDAMLNWGQKALLKLWRVWFYTLAAIPVLVLFPFLALLLLLPNTYGILFWIARNIWAPFVLFGMGFFPKIDNRSSANHRQSHVLIANHSSYIDIFLILRAWKTPFVFVGKKELALIPVFGYIYKRAAIMVDRGSSKSRYAVYGRANTILKKGYSICIFPEQDYLDETILLNPFKKGAFKLAVEHQLPILPMVFYDCKRKQPWYTTYGYPGQLRVNIFDPIPTAGMPKDAIPKLQEQAHAFIAKALQDDPEEKAKEAISLWKQLHPQSG